MAKRDYPTSKAQDQVLEALGLTATGYADAERKFKALGLNVIAKRVGRKSVPSIVMLDTEAGGMHQGDGWRQAVEFEAVDLSKVSQWVEG
jgi:hypothetical protein